MTCDPLMEAIVNIVLFLETASEDAIREDVAVGLTEEIAASLQQLGGPEQKLFAAYVRRRAAIATPDEAELLKRLPEDLGLLVE